MWLQWGQIAALLTLEAAGLAILGLKYTCSDDVVGIGLMLLTVEVLVVKVIAISCQQTAFSVLSVYSRH